MLIAFAVLVMAWINHVNLTAARAIQRAKEVGIRKVTGATRVQIICQFLTETFVLNIIALITAFVTAFIVAPHFYDFIGVPYPHWDTLSRNMNTTGWAWLLLFFTGILLSGLFPAQIISAYSPVHALKGNWTPSDARTSFRRAAVVFQFVCAMVLMISVVTFNRQFRYMHSIDPRIDIRHTLVLKAPSNVDSTYRMRFSGFKNHLKDLSIIHTVSTSSAVPGAAIGWTGAIRNEKEETSRDFEIDVIDPDFVDAYKLKLLAGRNFEARDFPIGGRFGNKPEPIILNKKGVDQLGYETAEDALGAIVFWGNNKCFVVGVVNDFNQEFAKNPIQPMLFTANMGPSLTLKLTEGADRNTTESLALIRKAWDVYFPNNAFDFAFLDDTYNTQYASDERTAKVFNLFCLLSL